MALNKNIQQDLEIVVKNFRKKNLVNSSSCIHLHLSSSSHLPITEASVYFVLPVTVILGAQAWSDDM